MKRLVVASGLVVLVAALGTGCATRPGAHARWHTGWDKPGISGEAFEADVRECDRAAMRVAGGQPGHVSTQAPAGGARAMGPGPMAPQRQAEHEKAYRDCMMSKGYTATAK